MADIIILFFFIVYSLFVSFCIQLLLYNYLFKSTVSYSKTSHTRPKFNKLQKFQFRKLRRLIKKIKKKSTDEPLSLLNYFNYIIIWFNYFIHKFSNNIDSFYRLVFQSPLKLISGVLYIILYIGLSFQFYFRWYTYKSKKWFFKKSKKIINKISQLLMKINKQSFQQFEKVLSLLIFR